ncbi:hypothetical protein ACQKP8_03505 [Photobacterium alginatilyticum]|uniref:hypothetical protein n=1 Tax=Photobacterium alginatilyticum TaxID=1775171 RepID=UPI00406923BC
MSIGENSRPNQGIELYDCEPFSLIIGIICGSTVQIAPLLKDIYEICRLQYLRDVEVYILANGENWNDVRLLSENVFNGINAPNVVILKNEEKDNILPIGQARTLLQRQLGLRMKSVAQSYAWILDDDMRIPEEAQKYLSWLPAFKNREIDVLIGNFNGSSPNPPAHGVRVQINDLIHNLGWLKGLPDRIELPNRSDLNEQFRIKYPDYYYDLSRKHKRHLKEPYWITPEYDGETVLHARERLINNVEKIITGAPFLRPLIAVVPNDPLSESKPSCNRGGNTFVLNHEALTLTPNTILLTNGEENRRSDMIWAIINSYCHNLKVHAISFPVYHHRYVNVSARFDLYKTVSEIRGSALYAALNSYFNKGSSTTWDDLKYAGDDIGMLYNKYIEERFLIYKDNFSVISSMLDEIERKYSDEFVLMSQHIKKIRSWVSQENLIKIENEVISASKSLDVNDFIDTLNKQIHSYQNNI